MQAAPLTLRILTEHLQHLHLSRAEDATLWALVLIGLYCMLYKSNLVPDIIVIFITQN